MFLYSVCPHACYTAHLYVPCYIISMMTLPEYLTLLYLPKHKRVKLAALRCNVGGDLFAFTVDASNILTDVFHVYPLPNPENSGVNTPLSSHDRYFPHTRLSSAQPRKLRGKYPTTQPRPLLSTYYPVFFIDC